MARAVLRRACHPEFRVLRRNGAAIRAPGSQPADASTFTQYGKRPAPGHHPDVASAYSKAPKAGKDRATAQRAAGQNSGTECGGACQLPGGRPG